MSSALIYGRVLCCMVLISGAGAARPSRSQDGAKALDAPPVRSSADEAAAIEPIAPEIYVDPAPYGLDSVPMGASGRIRDGFFFHTGAGVGLVHVSRDSNIDLAFEAPTLLGDSTIRDEGPMFELMLGGSPMRDFVLMVHLYLQALPGAELQSEQGESVELEDSATFVFLGGGGWWYPSRSLGLHLEASVGATQFQSDIEDAEQVDVGTTGVGAVLGGGYDFWLSREWSLGVSARLFTAGMSGTTRQTIQGLQARRTQFDFVLSGALLVGVQYH